MNKKIIGIAFAIGFFTYIAGVFVGKGELGGLLFLIGSYFLFKAYNDELEKEIVSKHLSLK